MMTAIKSELRKLLSVRSTYILLIVAMALICLFNYFGTSAATYEEAVCPTTGETLYSRDSSDPRLEGKSPEEVCGGQVTYTTKSSNDLPKTKLLFNLQETVPLIALFATVIVVLQMAHEFRYNTINYSLTFSNSRSKVLLSKILVSMSLVVVATVLAIGVSLAVTQVAIEVKNLHLPTQDFNWMYVISRHLAYTLIYALFFLGVITLVRNLAAGIVAILIIPMLDGIAGFLLAARNIQPARVLPFSALDRFGNVAGDISGDPANIGETFANIGDKLPPTSLGALAVVGVYLIGLWIVTWLLFLRRDAN